MKKITKSLILILLVLIIIKIILSIFVLSPSAFSDEYSFAKMARSFFYENEFSIHGIPTHQYFPLYPIILSITYLLKDMQIIYLFMKIINAILSSLIIIPAFLLAKEFISEKKALITALMISLYPASFSFFPLIMAENLFYPLFLFSIYFIYKTTTEKEYKWYILSGLFIGLTILTKINGLILILVAGILHLYKLKQGKFELKKVILSLIISMITILPWLLRNITLLGPSINGAIGNYSHFLKGSNFTSPMSLITWIIIYLGIIIISTGFIYFLINIIGFNWDNKNEKLKYFNLITIFSTFFVIIIAANANAHSIYLSKTLLSWLTWRPLTRTIDVVCPLIIINGIINLKNINKTKWKTLMVALSIPVLLITSQIVFFQLLPFNNMSLVLLGILSYPINYLIKSQIIISLIFSIIFITTFLLIYYLIIKNKINFKRLIVITILFFLASSIINYSLIVYNADKYWYKDEQMQLGVWFNEYDKGQSNILIDKRDEGTILKIGQTSLYERNKINNTVTKIGFFMNNNIIIADVNNLNRIGYVISKHKLDLNLIKQTEDNIFLYKTN